MAPKFKYGEYVEFKDLGWSALVRGLDQIDKRVVKVGFLLSSPKREGKGAIDMARLAAVHEFGAPAAGRGGKTKIPARPFIRPTADAKRAHFQGRQKEFLVQIINGLKSRGRVMNVDLALARMGEEMAGFIKRAIVDMKSPPNALATQRAKGRKVRGGGRAMFMQMKIINGRVSRGRKVFNQVLINNPLVDTGQMAGSVRWALTSDVSGGI
jgi:hypothetical protein